MPKGTFYYFYEPKEALAPAVIDEHGAAQKSAWAAILSGDAEHLQRLRHLFEATEAEQRAGQQSCGTVSGCLFGNLTRAVVAQLEGQVLFAKLYNNSHRLDPLWANCLALLGARAPRGAGAGSEAGAEAEG